MKALTLRKSWPLGAPIAMGFLLVCMGAAGLRAEVLQLGAVELGTQKTGVSLVWHDPAGHASLQHAQDALESAQFAPLKSRGSTGLKPGSFWSYFSLYNTTSQPLPVRLEYIDHQLTQLVAYVRPGGSGVPFEERVNLSLNEPFSARPVAHNRFVIPIELAPNQSVDILVNFSSRQAGFVFPSLRIWTANELQQQLARETGLMAFLFGGFFLMSLIALVAGFASGEKLFFAYALYSFTKITVWATVLGYTHQYLLREHFHWKLMSASGAVTIFCGLLFARLFLQSRQFIPKTDWVLRGMMLNALILLAAALLEIKVLALLSITLALLLYPMLTLAGVMRWRQGSREAAVFALAWSFLVVGLVVQALRDLGVVEHNLFNYYWPPVASFTEMLTIMAAMGLKLRNLRREKEQAQARYQSHLEASKSELEALVTERTRELENAKRQAEVEARTDHLTGVRNRRSFFHDAEKALLRAQRDGRPATLLMFDLDHFKNINDSYGHRTGDEALLRFTEVLLDRIRVTDIVGRLGGEEFALLVTEGQEAALALAERLRGDIEALSLMTPQGEVRFTTSIGVASPDESTRIDELVHQADEALYAAKRNGRNQVVIASSA